MPPSRTIGHVAAIALLSLSGCAHEAAYREIGYQEKYLPQEAPAYVAEAAHGRAG